MSSFFHPLFDRYPAWRSLPLASRAGDGWHGLTLEVPPRSDADLVGPLWVEEVGNEVTIGLDHAHVHLPWPPAPWGAEDPLTFIEAVLNEKIVAVSGWINGQLRVGSLRGLEDMRTPLIVPNLQKIRVRSWKGTSDSDEEHAQG